MKKKRILFTMGNVDRDIGGHSGRYSGRQSVDSEIDYRPSIGRYFDDAPRLTIGHMSVIYRSTVGGISVNCRWYIGELSVAYRSTVRGISVNCRSNISCVLIYQVSPMAFFKAKTSLITVIMRWRNMWQCEARLLYETNRRALGTKDMITFFFQFASSPIV